MLSPETTISSEADPAASLQPEEPVLTERQKDWLLTASRAAPREGRVFKRALLRDMLRISLEEGNEAATVLQKLGLVTLLPDDEAILTDAGRKRVEELLAARPSTRMTGA